MNYRGTIYPDDLPRSACETLEAFHSAHPTLSISVTYLNQVHANVIGPLTSGYNPKQAGAVVAEIGWRSLKKGIRTIRCGNKILWSRYCEEWRNSMPGDAMCVRAWQHQGECHFLSVRALPEWLEIQRSQADRND